MQAFIIISRDAHKSCRLINQHVTPGLGAARSTERAACPVRLAWLTGLAARGKGVEVCRRPFDTRGNAPVPKRVCKDRSRLERARPPAADKAFGQKLPWKWHRPLGGFAPGESTWRQHWQSGLVTRHELLHHCFTRDKKAWLYWGAGERIHQVIVYLHILAIASLSLPKKR